MTHAVTGSTSRPQPDGYISAVIARFNGERLNHFIRRFYAEPMEMPRTPVMAAIRVALFSRRQRPGWPLDLHSD
jgi:hypothetical protein